MNLHSIVSGAISAVNPPVPLIFQTSTGSAPSADGTLVPQYSRPVTVLGQIQALEDSELRQMDSLNIQGQRRKIYINGQVDGVVRVNQQGGDILTAPDGTVWLVVLVLEYWPDWCSLAVVLQDGS
jgi:hypothetical protein